MDHQKYVIGIDFGTDSVRAIVVSAGNGRQISSSVFSYPRWKAGLFCDASMNRFRQHPLDYLEGLESCITDALKNLSKEVKRNIVAISVDTTGSTPAAVDKHGLPLALHPEFADNPNAMFILWKDHTSVQEADEITQLSRTWGGEDYTRYVGGIYSSEWFWAKILHILREDEGVRRAAYSWVEHCDWIPGVLAGDANPLILKRSRCAAGHKAMWHAKFGGLPSEEFLVTLDPLLSGLRERLYKKTFTSIERAGYLCDEWADRLGIPAQVAIGVGSYDAHAGAVGGQIEPHYLSKVMGTSTCDMMIVESGESDEAPVAGICGQVDGSVVPGFTGLEAGQSAFGDIYAWFAKLLMWPVNEVISGFSWLDEETIERIQAESDHRLIAALSDAAEKISPEETSMVALDWLNGRRTPDANQKLKGVIAGISLGSDAPRMFRTLVEATAFGSRVITERFISEGVRVDGVIAMGGVARKSPFVVQMMADVLNMPIKVASADQASALGSAMAAAVVAGLYPDIPSAQRGMGAGFEKEYLPDPAFAGIYDRLFSQYRKLGKLIETYMN